MLKYLIMSIDPINFEIAIICMVIVFVTLSMLFFIFGNIHKLLKIQVRSSLKKKGIETTSESGDFVGGEENAAIAAAIYLYMNDLHDDESTKMTIKRVNKIYSPWSSKIHGLNILHR